MNLVELIFNKLIGIVFSFLPQPLPHNEKIANTKLIAHRGIHEDGVAAENSIESFRLAVKHSIWAIEFDVHFTKDHVPVISHDANAGRIYDRPDLVIEECTYQHLVTQVPLPTLNSVIEEFGHKIHLMIEIKQDLRNQTYRKRLLLDMLKSLKPEKDYHLLTLEPQYLSDFEGLSPSAIMDVIWLHPKRIFYENDKLNHGAIAGHFLFFSKRRIFELKQKGKFLGVGFIDSQNSLYRELNRGIDYIFTNHPLKLNKILRSFQ